MMKYICKVLAHKWFVLLAGFKVGLPLWRAAVHDISKFAPAELSYYSRYYFGKVKDPVGFAIAWLHHQNCNKHHWEYWMIRSDHSGGAVEGCLPMPRVHILEMIADWLGANRLYTGSWNMSKWLDSKFARITLHPDTRHELVRQLTRLGYTTWSSGWRCVDFQS